MLSVDHSRESAAGVRSAIVTFLCRQLRPLLGERDMRVTLADWVAPLSAETIARSLRATPGETADALTDAILRDSAVRYPDDAIADLIADSFPRMADAARARLIAFVRRVRQLAREHDGVVEDHHLFAAGFGKGEADRMMPDARTILGRLDAPASAAPAPCRPCATPIERLIEAGVRSAARRADAVSLAA